MKLSGYFIDVMGELRDSWRSTGLIHVSSVEDVHHLGLLNGCHFKLAVLCKGLLEVKHTAQEVEN